MWAGWVDSSLFSLALIVALRAIFFLYENCYINEVIIIFIIKNVTAM